jgi:hypothetical protein
MATTRGSWTLDEGIAARWEAQGLDATFRAEWPAGNTGYAPLNDGEARPETPQPYCIYEKSQPLIVGHHTGAVGGEAQQLQQIEVQFTVHAKSTNNESGKAIAKRMMTAIMTAYDPGTTKLSILPDCHIVVYRGADFHVREGDEEWAWTVLYEFLIDTTYNQ